MVKIPIKIFVEETEQLEHVYASGETQVSKIWEKNLVLVTSDKLHSWSYTLKLFKWAGSETWGHGKVLVTQA